MAVTRYVGNIIRGNTADPKPTDGVLDGSLYFELDGDKRVFEMFGGVWEELIGEDIEVVNSIEIDEGKIRLVGDEENPGNNKVYGTNASGERTWKDDPSGGGGGGGIELTSEITAATTLTAGHANKYIPVNSATPIDITIDGSVFDANDQIVLEQTGNGIITVVAGSGMTLNGALLSWGQYSTLSIFFKSATVATIVGGSE